LDTLLGLSVALIGLHTDRRHLSADRVVDADAVDIDECVIAVDCFLVSSASSLSSFDSHHHHHHRDDDWWDFGPIWYRYTVGHDDTFWYCYC